MVYNIYNKKIGSLYISRLAEGGRVQLISHKVVIVETKPEGSIKNRDSIKLDEIGPVDNRLAKPICKKKYI